MLDRPLANAQIDLLQVDAAAATSTFLSLFVSGILYQDATHGFCRSRKEVGATGPLFLDISSQAELFSLFLEAIATAPLGEDSDPLTAYVEATSNS